MPALKNVIIFFLSVSCLAGQGFVDEVQHKQDQQKQREKEPARTQNRTDRIDRIETRNLKNAVKETKHADTAGSFAMTLRQRWQSHDYLPFHPGLRDTLKPALHRRFHYQVGFISEGAHFDNADLRALNEENQVQINDSDDRISLAYSRFFLRGQFQVSHNLEFRVDLFKNGYWGNDQLSGNSNNNDNTSSSRGSDPFQFGELFVRGYFLRSKKHHFGLALGRQYFAIGSLKQDYILQGYLDGAVLTYGNTGLGRLRLLAVDVLQAASDPGQNINYLRYFAHDNNRVNNLNGDTTVLRHGLVYESLNLVNMRSFEKGQTGLQAKVYAFYARFGGVKGTGANLGSDGATSNLADNDFVSLVGSRTLFRHGPLDLFLDISLSRGIDRRLPGTSGFSRDINANGYAISGGFVLDFNTFTAAADAFYSSGASYDAAGNQVSHGFVSFGGAQAGGLLLNRFWGVHPSARISARGFASPSFDYQRSSGTLLVHTGFSVQPVGALHLALDGWLLLDTSQSKLTDSFATSSALRAQRRLGRPVGLEVDLELKYHFNEYWQLYAIGAAFLPGDLYNSADFASTSAPRGTHTFWGVLIGSKLVF